MNDQGEKYETWAIVELLGHKTIAGYVTEQSIAGAALVRIDVPETPADAKWGREYPATDAYTKLVGVGSIYALTPCAEAVARAAAREVERDNNPLPVSLPRQLALPSSATIGEDVEYEDNCIENSCPECGEFESECVCPAEVSS